ATFSPTFPDSSFRTSRTCAAGQRGAKSKGRRRARLCDRSQSEFHANDWNGLRSFIAGPPERCVMEMTQPQGPTAPKQTPSDTGSWQRALPARQVRFRRQNATRFMPLIVSPPAPVKWTILEKNDASMLPDRDDSQQPPTAVLECGDSSSLSERRARQAPFGTRCRPSILSRRSEKRLQDDVFSKSLRRAQI